MAEIRVKVVGDFRELKNQFREAFKQMIRSKSSGDDVTTSAVPASKKNDGKKDKQTGFLATIASRVLPLALLLQLKPIKDLMNALLGFATIGILSIIKFLKNTWDAIMGLRSDLRDWLLSIFDKIDFTGIIETIKEWVGNVWQSIKDGAVVIGQWLAELPGKIWDFLKELPGKIWEFVKNLASSIWNLLKQGFDAVKNVVANLWSAIVDWFGQTVDWLKNLWDGIKEWLGNSWETLKGLPEKIWNFLKEGFDKVTDWLSKLPGLIWDKIQALAGMIADKLRGIIGGIGSGIKRIIGVNDAIITKDGKVIKTNPQDTIMATKSPGGMGGPSITNNFYGLTYEQAFDKFQRQLNSTINRAGRF